MAATRKVVITCAVTGAIHTPSMSPHLPVTPDKIIADSLAAAEAGAAILHLHARNPENGRPDQTPEAFARFLPRIKQQTNAVINITSAGFTRSSTCMKGLPPDVMLMTALVCCLMRGRKLSLIHISEPTRH